MLLKVADAAKLLNVDPSTVYSYVARGMEHVRFSPRCIRFKLEHVSAWIDKCQSTKEKMADTRSPSCKGGDEFTAFAHRTRPKPKQRNGKTGSGEKSSGLTNLVAFPNTASNKP